MYYISNLKYIAGCKQISRLCYLQSILTNIAVSFYYYSHLTVLIYVEPQLPLSDNQLKVPHMLNGE